MLVSRPDVFLKERTPRRIKRVLGSINMRGYRVLKDQVKLLIDYKTKTSQKHAESIREIAFLGRGGFGAVFKAEYMGINVAVKKSRKTNSSINEIEILKLLNGSRNIVSLLDNFEVKKRGKLSEIWLIMELCEPGDLFHAMKLIGRSLRLLEVKAVAFDVLGALVYIHDKLIVHCDIKGLNIIISNDGYIKLCDLGTAVNLTWNPERRKRNEKKFVSDKWMAPEMLTTSNINSKIDIWSLGITLIELYMGEVPFHELSGTLAMGTIVGLADCSRESQLYQLNLNPSNKMHHFISRFLETDPDKRPSASQLHSSDFFKPSPTRFKLKALARSLMKLRAEG